MLKQKKLNVPGTITILKETRYFKRLLEQLGGLLTGEIQKNLSAEINTDNNELEFILQN